MVVVTVVVTLADGRWRSGVVVVPHSGERENAWLFFFSSSSFPPAGERDF